MAFFDSKKSETKKLNHTPLKIPSKIRTFFLYLTSAVVIIVVITIFYLNYVKKTEITLLVFNKIKI